MPPRARSRRWNAHRDGRHGRDHEGEDEAKAGLKFEEEDRPHHCLQERAQTPVSLQVPVQYIWGGGAGLSWDLDDPSPYPDP